MSKKLRNYFVAMLIATTATAIFLVPNPTFSADKPITIKVADFLPPTHIFFTCSMEKWLKELELSGGEKVKIDFHGGGKLLGARELLDGVRMGVADIGVLVIDYWPDRLDLAAFCSLPYVFPDPSTGTKIIHGLMKGTMGDDFRNEGVEPIMVLLCTPRQISLSKTAVNSLNDFKGLKLRALGWEAKTIERLGASTVFMSATEGTTSQKTGVIDGSTQTYYGMPGWGLMDITKEVVELRGHTHTLVVVAANKKKWDSWPDDVKKLLTNVSSKIESEWVACQEAADEKVKTQFRDMGVPIYSITDAELETAKKLTKPVFDTWVETVGENGTKVISEYEALTD